MDSIADWCARLGLPQYAQRFVDNDIDMSVLANLSEDDLKELGISSLGHRRKIMVAIGQLSTPGAQSLPPPQPRDGAERRQLSLMFCDLVDSTALSARLDPEEMRKVIAAYQAACAPIIAGYDGLVAKFMGDGILAYFGYPRAHEDDAERAVRASLAIAAAVGQLKNPAAGTLRVRIGVATGLVVVGELIGEGAAQEQSVVGDAPNLAARLQSLAEAGTVVISASTRRLIGNLFQCRTLGRHTLKGFAEPIEAWTVEGLSNSESRFEAAHAENLIAFVGRASECSLILQRLGVAWRGEGQIVLISGDAGIGKSRFAAWLTEHVAEQPHSRIRYHCSPYHRESALYPIIQQLERSADIRATDAVDIKLSKLEHLLNLVTQRAIEVAPLFASLLSIPFEGHFPTLSLSPAQQRRQTLSALLEQLEGLARQGPVLVLFEDAHWADATSLELINLAVERLRQLPVLFLITFRPEFEPPWEGLGNVTRIDLGKLDQGDVETLVGQMTAGRALPAEVMRQIVAKTDGVPLFVEELTKTIQESGILVAEGDHYRLNGPLPSLAIPSTLQDSLMARLDRLTPLKEIVQTGAAIGREFSYSMLQAVTAQDRGSLMSALTQLEEAGMVFRTGSPPDARYTFKHALVQDAAYESLLKSSRLVLHKRIAEVLRDKFDNVAAAQPELIAQHFAQAEILGAAIEWWNKAGDLALRRAAYSEAAAHLRKAIELVDQPGAEAVLPVAAKLKLQIAYGQALLHGLGWTAEQTIAAFARARETAAGIDDPKERLAIYYGLWGGSYVRAELAAMRETAERFLVDAQLMPGSPDEGVAQRLLGQSCWFAGDYAGAREHFERAVAIYHDTRHASLNHTLGQDVGVAAKIFLSLVLWPQGHVDRARQLVDEAVSLAERSGHVPTLAYAHFHALVYETIRGENARGVPHADALSKLCQEHSVPVWKPASTFALGWSLRQRGELATGLETMRHGLAQFRELGLGIYLPILGLAMAETAGKLSGASAGLSVIDETLSECERSGQHWLTSLLHRLRGDLLLLAEPVDTRPAAEAYRRAISVAEHQGVRSLKLLAALDLAKVHQTSGHNAESIVTLHDALEGFVPTPEFREIEEANSLLTTLSN